MPVSTPKKTYTQKEFIEHVALYEHLPKSVLNGALDAIIEDLCYLLADGNIVEVGELGFFSTSLKCLRNTDDEANKIRSESVVFQNVHLRISSEFRKKIERKMKLKRVHSPSRKLKNDFHDRRTERETDSVPTDEYLHHPEGVCPTS